MGRPKLPPGEGRGATIHIRVTPRFKARADAYAESKGVSLTTLIEQMLERAMKRDKFTGRDDR